MTPDTKSGAQLARAHAGRFRIVPYAELRSKSAEVADMIFRRYGSESIVIAPILGGGGLPARLIVDVLLGLEVEPTVVPCQIRRYSGLEHGGAIELLLALDRSRVKDQVVIGIDDMVDGGQTLEAFRAHALAQGAREVETAVIYAKPTSKVVAGFVAEEGVTEWLVMPGEELNFVSELVRRDSELAQLPAGEQALYFEALGLPHEVMLDWARLRATKASGVQWG